MAVYYKSSLPAQYYVERNIWAHLFFICLKGKQYQDRSCRSLTLNQIWSIWQPKKLFAAWLYVNF